MLLSRWCPTLGWIEVDPTNDLVPSDRHIVLGYGRDYDDVSPVKGVTLGGGSHTVEVAVQVDPAEAVQGSRLSRILGIQAGRASFRTA